MMGEVIINDFTFTIFDFVNYLTEQCAKPKLKILRCAHAQKQIGRICYMNAAETYVAMERMKHKNAAKNYKTNSRIFWLSKNMENDVNSKELLCNKISENQRKGFLQLLDRGMNKFKKRLYFRTIRH